MADRELQFRTKQDNVYHITSIDEDDIYSLLDDFDTGELNTKLWTTGQSKEAQAGINRFGTENEDESDGSGINDDDLSSFRFISDEINGWISGDTGKTDEASIRLYSAHALWSPARRCTVQMRLEFNTFTSLKFELGFVNPQIDLQDSTVKGAVNLKSTPTVSSFFGDSSVIVYDTDHNTSCDVFTARNATAALTAQRGPSALANPNTFTFMLATSETGNAKYWINGIYAGQVFLAPNDVTDVNGVVTSQGSSVIHPTSNKHIWLMAQNRADNVSHAVRADYIHAWQERGSF